jgi:hypothetical protein
MTITKTAKLLLSPKFASCSIRPVFMFSFISIVSDHERMKHQHKIIDNCIEGNMRAQLILYVMSQEGLDITEAINYSAHEHQALQQTYVKTAMN